MTFGFGNQHSIQLSYGRADVHSTVPRRTSVQRRLGRGAAPRYNAAFCPERRGSVCAPLRSARSPPDYQPPARTRNDHAGTRPARLPDQELEAARRRRRARVRRADRRSSSLLSQLVTERHAGRARGRQARSSRASSRSAKCSSRARERPEGPAHRRRGLRPGLQDLPRSGRRRRAEVRRQGGVGEGDRAGPGDDGRARVQRHSRDAAEGRQSRSSITSKSSAASSTWPTRPAPTGRNRRRPSRRLPLPQPPQRLPHPLLRLLRLPLRRPHRRPRRARLRPPAAASKPDGKKIYETTCTVCHGAGIAGAPKFGDKAAWAPRLATGIDALYKRGADRQGRDARRRAATRSSPTPKSRPPSTTWWPRRSSSDRTPRKTRPASRVFFDRRA